MVAVTNDEVEQRLRNALQGEGYQLNSPRKRGEHGADIIACGSVGTWYIEVIGYKRRGFQRSWDFNTAFFGAVSRLNDRAEHCVIAMAKEAKLGLPVRAQQHRVAWERIAKAFPELEIWLVDTSNGGYERTSWGEWLR